MPVLLEKRGAGGAQVMRLRHSSSGGGAEVAHRHSKLFLEEILEVCWIPVAASRRDDVHLVPCSGKQPLHLVQSPFRDGVEDGAPLKFPEAEVGKTS